MADNLRIATCQFDVSGDVEQNANTIKRYIRRAASKSCHVVHFCETALSGYAGTCPEFGVSVFDLESLDGYEWDRLTTHTDEIINLAKTLNIWIILGSTHPISNSGKPTNCLYVISPEGIVEDRYEKMMCTPGDLLTYAPGNHLVTATINGVLCGFLICADLSNPDLFSRYKQMGVRVLLHSSYNARFLGPIPNDDWVVPEISSRAKEFGMWTFANNSSARHSSWPTLIAAPNGDLTKLRRHRPGMLIRNLTPGELI